MSTAERQATQTQRPRRKPRGGDLLNADQPGAGLVVDLGDVFTLTDDALLRLGALNDNLQLESDPHGRLVIMPPSGSKTGIRNAKLALHLGLWNREAEAGVVTGPDGGFHLPGEGRRAPDAAFVAQERWDAVPEAEQERLAPLCPDFVVELCSPSDRVAKLQEKMEEYLRAGLRLGWLIDPFEEVAYIYHPERAMQVVASFDEALSGEDVLPGFTLPLSVLR